MIVRLFAVERPLRFYGVIGALLAALALILSTPVLLTYIETGLVPRFPTAILSTGIAILSALSFCLLYTSDAADERSSVDLGGRRLIKKKN